MYERKMIMNKNTNTKKNTSARKKLIPAIGMLAISASMLATSTYAWFTMNKTVTVSGMTMNTYVESNLLIDDVAPCHGGAWSAGSYATNDSTFKSSTTQTIDAANVLVPLSTTDAYNFFVTKPDNVTGKGDAIANEYKAVSALSDVTATGYYPNATGTWLDYHFVLKAVNTDSDTAQNINLSELKMTFSEATDNEKAWRVAVLSKKFTTATVDGAKTLPGIDTAGATVTKIYTPSGAANFESGKAVNSTTATGAVTYASSASDSTIATVAAGATEYYEVIVRVWLEGEDTTCNVNTFQPLVDGTWNLETKFTLESGTTSGVYVIEQATTSTP